MNPDHAHPAGADITTAGPSPAVTRPIANLDSMPVIEQAKGIIMAKTGQTEAEAFGLLQQISQRRNVPVRDLAAWLVASAVHNPPPTTRRVPAQQRPPI